ncbi:hypothetical protein DBV15_02785 [Temnothorax longispinosus]|uniref:DNA topoisomerase n=1 Tax=Temnothorax longispinosus TaxID=300112 RepID=A0A4S2KGS1_9HYME|nr:hypothetical protein DBV15_02785 [Temnothorax longispinosus]
MIYYGLKSIDNLSRKKPERISEEYLFTRSMLPRSPTRQAAKTIAGYLSHGTSRKATSSLESIASGTAVIYLLSLFDAPVTEGKNLGFEIIQVCQAVKPNIHSIKFLEITRQSVERTLQTLGREPDKAMTEIYWKYSGITPRQGRKSDEAHTPVYPTIKYTDNLQGPLFLFIVKLTALISRDLSTGNEAKVYEFVVHHFLACLSKNAEGRETTVEINIARELRREIYG